MRTKDWWTLALFILISQAAGFIGTFFTTPAIPGWYASLEKPEFSPPNWIFAPVWTTLYLLMGIAAFLVWHKGSRGSAVKKALAAFWVQLTLNAAWSILFFGLKSPILGLVCILALWVAIAVTIARFAPLSKVAAWLMAPYLAWVSFATALNFEIYRLN